jgi:hypothetical protein
MHQYFSTGQYKDVIKKIRERCNKEKMPIPVLEFKGTVKLHGTNSALYQVLNDKKMFAQSKNNIITPEKDNYGFAKFAYYHEQHDRFDRMFDFIRKNYPDSYKNHETAVIYGEWCGSNIQENVALFNLDKMFVIFAIKLVDKNHHERWLSENEIHDVFESANSDKKLKDLSIFNIYDFPCWTLSIDMNNPKLKQNDLVRITDEVEKRCPVAYTWGVEGIGEGVVWRCTTIIPGIQTDDLVFKVKGKEHSVTNVSTTALVDVEKVNSINEFVDKVVTDNRLKQGLEYLKEQHLEIENKSISVFLKWITSDCIKEESDTMEESGLDKKEVMPAISAYAKQWFLKEIAMQDDKKIGFKMKM